MSNSNIFNSKQNYSDLAIKTYLSLDDNSLEQAAQYAFDNFLSKPYINTKVNWDWNLTLDNELINRPNHGLAHSLRGASYAPVVIEYYKRYGKDKETFQFSEDEVRKIQIALMFRVAGRENDAGYFDNPEDYKRYQKNHGEAFRQYCVDNPGIFSPKEVDIYVNALQNYANPAHNEPIMQVMRACHNLDLLRCVQDERYAESIAPIREQIGDEYTTKLVNYAYSCIRKTGNRVTCGSNLHGGLVTYNYDSIFLKASTNVNACMSLISSVQPPIQFTRDEPKAEEEMKKELIDREYIEFFLFEYQSELKKPRGSWKPVGNGWEIGISGSSGNPAIANSQLHIELDNHKLKIYRKVPRYGKQKVEQTSSHKIIDIVNPDVQKRLHDFVAIEIQKQERNQRHQLTKVMVDLRAKLNFARGEWSNRLPSGWEYGISNSSGNFAFANDNYQVNLTSNNALRIRDKKNGKADVTSKVKINDILNQKDLSKILSEANKLKIKITNN